MDTIFTYDYEYNLLFKGTAQDLNNLIENDEDEFCEVFTNATYILILEDFEFTDPFYKRQTNATYPREVGFYELRTDWDVFDKWSLKKRTEFYEKLLDISKAVVI